MAASQDRRLARNAAAEREAKRQREQEEITRTAEAYRERQRQRDERDAIDAEVMA